jgi:hypothetical protein
VDVEQCEESAHSYSVQAMPTFIFFKNKVLLSRIQGADPTALENKIRELVGSSADGESGGQSTDAGVVGHIDLLSFINKSESECLNESDAHNLSGCLTSGSSNYLESDCDEQLIINLAFTQPLKLHSLKIIAPKENGPKHIKLFINQPRTLDFDQSSSMEPIQQMELSAEDISNGNPVPLRYVKYQNVQNLLVWLSFDSVINFFFLYLIIKFYSLLI